MSTQENQPTANNNTDDLKQSLQEFENILKRSRRAVFRILLNHFPEPAPREMLLPAIKPSRGEDRRETAIESTISRINADLKKANSPIRIRPIRNYGYMLVSEEIAIAPWWATLSNTDKALLHALLQDDDFQSAVSLYDKVYNTTLDNLDRNQELTMWANITRLRKSIRSAMIGTIHTKKKKGYKFEPTQDHTREELLQTLQEALKLLSE